MVTLSRMQLPLMLLIGISKLLASARLNQQFTVEAGNEVRKNFDSSVGKDCDFISYFQLSPFYNCSR